MPLDFTAIDFETANSHGASACAVGLVRVRDGKIAERASWLIKPEEPHNTFLPFNTKIHGITAAMVEGAKSWQQQLQQLNDFIGDDIVIAHNAGFDMGVIKAACHASITPTPKFKYLCSVHVSRKTYDIPSHRLPLAAAAAGYSDFAHHDALADAEACAAIIIDAAAQHDTQTITALVKATGVSLKQVKAIPLKL